MTHTIDMIEELEKLAAWHRMMATQAGSDWAWEARLLAAEDLERRATDLREQQAARPTEPEWHRPPANSMRNARKGLIWRASPAKKWLPGHAVAAE